MSFHTAACNHLTTHLLSHFCAYSFSCSSSSSSSCCCCCCCCCCACNTAYFRIFVKMDLQKHLVILSFFFSTLDPGKRENAARVKDFGGGRCQGRPRVGSYTPTTARRRRIYGLAPDSRPGAHLRVKDSQIDYRRKFRSQTSDNMDRWKAEMERVREKRRVEERRIEERRSEKRKSQKKEDAGARKGIFPMICGSRGSKSRLAKAAGAEPSGQMRDEKLHAVVARSTFRSQNV